MIKRLPESTCLLYSEQLQQCWLAAPSGRGITFVKKTVRGHVYWYLQVTVGSTKRQFYLGPESEQLLKDIGREQQLLEAAQSTLENRKRLVAMLRAGGAYTPAPIEARILELLERAGVFLAGGVLVCSHAFRLYANMLGVYWESEATRTQDVDVASENRVKIALEDKPVHLRKALLQAGLGFFEIPILNPKHPSTRFAIRDKQIRVDIITPMRGPTTSQPIFIRSLNTPAEPVRFLDYLLDDVQKAAVVARAGIIVNVPSPARYALHKLVLSQRRPATEQTKARKDILQAGQLIAVLIEDRPEDFILALEAADAQPSTFKEQLKRGFRHLEPELRQRFNDEVIFESAWWKNHKAERNPTR